MERKGRGEGQEVESTQRQGETETQRNTDTGTEIAGKEREKSGDRMGTQRQRETPRATEAHRDQGTRGGACRETDVRPEKQTHRDGERDTEREKEVEPSERERDNHGYKRDRHARARETEELHTQIKGCRDKTELETYRDRKREIQA